MIATWITCDLDNQVWLESRFENTRNWGKKNFLLDMDPATAFITLCVFFIVLTLCSLGTYKYCHSTEMIELIQRTPPLEVDEWTFISNIIQKVKLHQTVAVFVTWSHWKKGWEHVMRCAIWYHLYCLKNVKNTHGDLRIIESISWQ